LVNLTRHQPKTFDPFGFDNDPFSEAKQTKPFDPFAPNTSQTVPTVSYDAKKKQIETLMTTSGVNPTSMTPLAPSTSPLTPVTFPATTGFVPQTGFQGQFQQQMTFPVQQGFPTQQSPVWPNPVNQVPNNQVPNNQVPYTNPFLQPTISNNTNPFA